MSEELQTYLTLLYATALKELHDAGEEFPTPENPPTAQHEKAADEFCRALVYGEDIPTPNLEVSFALAARLPAARVFGLISEPMFAQQSALGDASANVQTVLEWSLVKLWHEKGKDLWLEGQLQ